MPLLSKSSLTEPIKLEASQNYGCSDTNNEQKQKNYLLNSKISELNSLIITLNDSIKVLKEEKISLLNENEY